MIQFLIMIIKKIDAKTITQVLDLVEYGPFKMSEAARLYSLNRQTVWRWLQRKKRNPKVYKNVEYFRFPIDRDLLKDFLVRCVREDLKPKDKISNLIHYWLYGHSIKQP